MIRLEDLCDPQVFSASEGDGIICYIRFFMEAILSDSHDDVKINVFVKEKRHSLFNLDAFTLQNKNKFDIVLFRDDRNKMMSSLSRELYHIKQHLEDGFYLIREENRIYWNWEPYCEITDVARLIRTNDVERRNLLPWIQEANLAVVAVVDMVAEKIDNVSRFGDDPKLEKCLKVAMSESSYENRSF